MCPVFCTRWSHGKLSQSTCIVFLIMLLKFAVWKFLSLDGNSGWWLSNPYLAKVPLITVRNIHKHPRLPWWLGEESAFQRRRHGFDPWPGRIPHAAQQLASCATAASALGHMCFATGEAPAMRGLARDWRGAPPPATREKPSLRWRRSATTNKERKLYEKNLKLVLRMFAPMN